MKKMTTELHRLLQILTEIVQVPLAIPILHPGAADIRHDLQSFMIHTSFSVISCSRSDRRKASCSCFSSSNASEADSIFLWNPWKMVNCYPYLRSCCYWCMQFVSWGKHLAENQTHWMLKVKYHYSKLQIVWFIMHRTAAECVHTANSIDFSKKLPRRLWPRRGNPTQTQSLYGSRPAIVHTLPSSWIMHVLITLIW